MLRFVLGLMVVVAALVAAGTTMAFQCPTLVHSIYDAAGNRFDSGAYDAKQKAAQAAKLHAEGKHLEAELIAKQGIKLLINK